MPNSLIFAVILAVWAAYLVQHWIRRRDHVATARSVDRFSEAMRVLERRQSLSRADLTPPAPRSYALSLTRPAHPDVVVKRASAGVAVGAPARRTTRRLRRPAPAVVRATLLMLGLLAGLAGTTLWVTGRAPGWTVPAGVGGLLLTLALVRMSVARQRRRTSSPVRAQSARPRTSAPVQSEATQRRHASQPGRAQAPQRRRPSTPVRTQTAQRRRPSTPVRTQTAQRRRPKRARPAPERVVVAAADPPVAPGSARPEQHGPEPLEPEQHVQHVRQVVAEVQVHDVGVYDVAAHEDHALGAARREDAVREAAPTGRSAEVSFPVAQVDAEPVAAADAQPVAVADAPAGTWAPVAVPPPTYTLKARAARRPSPVPTAPAEETAPVTSRSTVLGLPFDGNALTFEEEFEDLPPVHSVG